MYGEESTELSKFSANNIVNKIPGRIPRKAKYPIMPIIEIAFTSTQTVFIDIYLEETTKSSKKEIVSTNTEMQFIKMYWDEIIKSTNFSANNVLGRTCVLDLKKINSYCDIPK